MEKGRWIVRAACLTILLGFFMPTMAVSCSGSLVDSKQFFSLADLASLAKQSVLYLVPAAAVAALILTFLYMVSPMQQKAHLWGQIGAIAIGFISVVGSLLSLSSQIQQGTYGLFKVSIEFGAFVLIAGLIAFGVGWVMEWQAYGNPGGNFSQGVSRPPEYPIAYTPQNVMPVDLDPTPVLRRPDEPYLELIQGQLSSRMIPITGDDFSIGRSTQNHLILPDRSISKLHVRLRYAQGSWYLQDQESGNGTFVNGENVQARRLNPGDEIGIGPFLFVFHT